MLDVHHLSPGRLGVGAVGRPEHGHEDLGLADVARLPINDGHGAAGVVDEHPLSGLVVLPHPDRSAARPLAVQVAEPAVLVA